MNAVTAVVAVVIHHLRRDRSSIIFLVLLPVGLMYLMGNIYESEDSDVATLALMVEDQGVETAAMADLLTGSEAVDIVAVGSRDDLDDRVRRRDVDAGVVLRAGEPAQLVGPPQVALPGGISFVVRGAQSRVDAASSLSSQSPDVSFESALASLPSPSPVPVAGGSEARTEAAIGVLVLVAFMNLIAFSSLVPSHRELGVIDRLGAAPVRRGAILAGYASAFVTVALIQGFTMLLAGRLLAGISWGPTLEVVGVVAALAVAAGGLATLTASLLPTPESGSSIGGPAGFALGMLGGCLWPLAFVGGFLETIGRWVPHNWAVETLRDIADGAAGTGQIALAAGALIAVGLVFGLIGSRRFSATWA